MSFHFAQQSPPPSLAAFVESMFYAHGRIDYAYDRILPTPRIVAVLNLGKAHRVGKEPAPGKNPICDIGWITGLQRSPVYNEPLDGTHVFGCIFDPIGFHRLFGVDMTDLVDRCVPLTEHSEATPLRDLQQSLVVIESEVELFEVAMTALSIMATSASEVRPWLSRGYSRILETQGLLSLESLYQELEVSGRHFNSTFQRAVGMTPKGFCRLLRLNALLPELDPNGEHGLADLAARYGYADQAHFNRDFQEFTGVNPTDYFTKRQAGFGPVEKGQDPLFVPHEPKH